MSKKRIIKLTSRVMASLDLPEEALGFAPKITMVGMDHMLVENHTGIYEYYDDSIRLTSKCGIISIRGSGLQIKELNSERLYITGKITGACFE